MSIQQVTDEELVAYLDHELPLDRRREIDAGLETDAALRHRLAALDVDADTLKAAFGTLANGPSIELLRSRIDDELRRLEAAPRANRWLRAAAALLLGAGTGYGASIALGHTKDGGWRDAVAAYQALYTTETLASLPDDTETQRRLKRAQLLQFEGRPLGQFSYLDASGAPVAFCISRTLEQDSRAETGRFRGLAAVFWSKGGYGFVLIGAAPIETLQRAAAALAAKIS
jgi:anti-sigma factor RsiW